MNSQSGGDTTADRPKREPRESREREPREQREPREAREPGRSAARSNTFDPESQSQEYLNWELINQRVPETIKQRIEKAAMCSDMRDKFASMAEMLMYPDLLLTNFTQQDVNKAIGSFNVMLIILDMLSDRDDADSGDFVFYEAQLRFLVPVILKRTMGEMRERMLQNTQMMKQIVEESVAPRQNKKKSSGGILGLLR